MCYFHRKVETIISQYGYLAYFKTFARLINVGLNRMNDLSMAKSPFSGKLLNSLKSSSKVAVYDPMCWAEDFFEFYALDEIPISDVYVQTVETVGTLVLGHTVRPVTELPSTEAEMVFVIKMFRL